MVESKPVMRCSSNKSVCRKNNQGNTLPVHQCKEILKQTSRYFATQLSLDSCAPYQLSQNVQAGELHMMLTHWNKCTS